MGMARRRGEMPALTINYGVGTRNAWVGIQGILGRIDPKVDYTT